MEGTVRETTQAGEMAGPLPRVVDAGLPGLRVIELALHADHRGWFFEQFRTQQYRNLLGQNVRFVQGNVSLSAHHVLRGLHLQPNHPQGKLVGVLRGEIWDVAVDARPGSPTIGQWRTTTLSEPSVSMRRQLWIPPGFAHGFVVTSGPALVAYQCSRVYHPEDEVCLKWNDPDLAIDWPVAEPVVSLRDSRGLSWAAWARGRVGG